MTPTIDSLVQEGVELNRHYVHMMCTPSRSSFQSGRLPAHVLTVLSSPCDENGAIPRNMTGIAAVLKKAGYATHQVLTLLSCESAFLRSHCATNSSLIASLLHFLAVSQQR